MSGGKFVIHLLKTKIEVSNPSRKIMSERARGSFHMYNITSYVRFKY